MKAVLAIVLALGCTVAAKADIPGNNRPHNGVEQREYDGAEAQEKYNSLSGPDLLGSSFVCGSTTYRVDRSADGLQQTICNVYVPRCSKDAPTYSCTDEKSTNGQPLPRFVPVRAMG